MYVYVSQFSKCLFLKSRFLLLMEDIGVNLGNCIMGNKCTKMCGCKDESVFLCFYFINKALCCHNPLLYSVWVVVIYFY